MNQESASLKINFAGELLEREFKKQEWLVDRLLGPSKRISLLAGRPRAGKSTLAWQLSVAVAGGRDFLGRSTKRSPVLFWNRESTDRQINGLLKQFGYDKLSDEQIAVVTPSPANNNPEGLKAALTKLPGTGLLVIENLSRVLRVRDLNDNTEVGEQFEILMSALNKFLDHTSVLAIHQLKKRQSEFALDGILGATDIAAQCDGAWVISRVSDEDQRRTFMAEVREGDSIPLSATRFELPVGLILGLPVDEARKQKTLETQNRVRLDVLTFFAKNSGATLDECFAEVSGKRDVVRKVFKQACLDGVIKKTSGTGAKGNPFRYGSVEVPTEERIAA
ncbi:MAG TPA: AAA family ATPase [Candidatus Acidoferrales bacterium]|nr:AAA family ATPase [Candidatus Acidoferrales bacterium]